MSETAHEFPSDLLGSSQALPLDTIPPSTPANMEVDARVDQQQAAPTRSQAPRGTGGGLVTENVPKVVDELAVSVMDAFEKFLETYVNIMHKTILKLTGPCLVTRMSTLPLPNIHRATTTPILTCINWRTCRHLI